MWGNANYGGLDVICIGARSDVEGDIYELVMNDKEYTTQT